MEQKPIELHVKISAKELFSFMLRHTYTSGSGLFGLVISLLCLILLGAGYAKGDDFRTVVLLALGLMFTVVNPILLYMKAKNQAMTNPVYKNELVYTLDDTGVTLNGEAATETVEWSKIRKWKKTRILHILYTTPIHAILLPVVSMKGNRAKVEALLESKLKKK